MKIVGQFALTAAGILAAAIGFGAPASHAGSYGDAQWCAVQSTGDGDVHWDCEYRSAEACAPQVIAGNRGFCNLNPYWVPAAAAQAGHRKRHS